MQRFTPAALAAFAWCWWGPAYGQSFNPYPNSDPSRIYGSPPTQNDPGRGGPLGQQQRRSYGEDLDSRTDRRNTYSRSGESDRYNLHPPSYGYPQDRYNNQQYNNNNGQFGLVPVNPPDPGSGSSPDDSD
jgi:hypothetical protein